MKYRCPSCNFPIFNRRVKNCESCNALLPQELLYTEQQIEESNAEAEKNKAQLDRLRRKMGVAGNAGGSAGGDSGYGDWGGDCGGDGGGGGDCG